MNVWVYEAHRTHGATGFVRVVRFGLKHYDRISKRLRFQFNIENVDAPMSRQTTTDGKALCFLQNILYLLIRIGCI